MPKPYSTEQRKKSVMDKVPEVGVALEVENGIRRVLAPNASAMTHYGTNTYLIGESEVAVVDPGPENRQHLDAIIKAAGGEHRITHIIVTHAHVDHSEGVAYLAKRTGAPVYAYGPADRGQSDLMKRLTQEGMQRSGEGVDSAFRPDFQLEDGDRIKGKDWALDVIWTPGHIGNHICLGLNDVVLSGDHVMQWATSIVSPPDGDVGAFINSCQKLLTRPDRIYLPGHGENVIEPQERTQWLIDHRISRESQIVEVLESGPLTPIEIVQKIYTDIPSSLFKAAERNVFAHLIDLCDRKIAHCDGLLRVSSRFQLVK